MAASSLLPTHHPAMSATATLTNCYVPLPAVSSSSSSTTNDNYDPYARPNTDNQHDDTSLTTTHQAKKNPSQQQQQHTAASTSTRGPRTLRQLHLAKSILSQSTGSALVEWGHTKVMVSVRGPRPNNCSSMNNTNNNSILSCEVRYMSNVGIRMETLARHSLANDFSSNSGSIATAGGGLGGAKIPRDSIGTANDTSNLLSGISAPAAFLDETYLSKRLYEAILPSVIVNEELMKSNKMCIEVFVQILQSDGGVFGASVMGASLALVDAGIQMRDLVCASSAAVMKREERGDGGKKGERKVTYHAIADPTEDEILQSCGVVTIAMMPNWKECTVWDQFGKMSIEASSEAMELARDGCMTCHKFLKTCLLEG